MENKTEVWLRGPLEYTPALLQPVAQALLQAREEINEFMKDFPEELLWQQPAGAASPGFHLQHLTGVLDRLFTYAKGEQLSELQLNKLSREGVQQPSVKIQLLLQRFNKQVEDSITELNKTNESFLTQHREVGRNKLPSTVIGLYTHAAEHTMRHTGQLLVTVKFLKSGLY